MTFGIAGRIGSELDRIVRQFAIIILQAFVAQIWLDFNILKQLLKKYHSPDVGRNNAIGQLYLGGYPTISFSLVL